MFAYVICSSIFLSLAILVFNFYWGPTADNLSAIMCFYFILFFIIVLLSKCQRCSVIAT